MVTGHVMRCLALAQAWETIQDLIGDRRDRETMSTKGQQLVDGNGAKPVVSAMVSMLD